jgi:hypothetical protein
MSTLRASFVKTLVLFAQKVSLTRSHADAASAAETKESNRKRLEEQLEYLFDVMFPPGDCKTIGERAEQSRRQKKFVQQALSVLREFARALSVP